jgi:hypothetical protein
MSEPLNDEEQRRALVLLHDTLIRLTSIKTNLKSCVTASEYHNFKIAKDELKKFIDEMYSKNKPIS